MTLEQAVNRVYWRALVQDNGGVRLAAEWFVPDAGGDSFGRTCAIHELSPELIPAQDNDAERMGVSPERLNAAAEGLREQANTYAGRTLAFSEMDLWSAIAKAKSEHFKRMVERL